MAAAEGLRGLDVAVLLRPTAPRPRTIRELPGMITIAIASMRVGRVRREHGHDGQREHEPGMAWIASMTRWRTRSRRPSQ